MTYRTLLFIIALAAAGTSVAKEISATEALQRLNSAANLPSAAKAPAAAQAADITTFYTTDQKPALYLYTHGNQLMVLPADDRVSPLLGYTDQPATGQMPPQLQWWLGEYARQIQYLQQLPESSSANYAPQAADEASTDKAPIAPKLTTTWNQKAPYNNLCPELPNADGEMIHAYTGCVATALAQVVNYHRYPDQPTQQVFYFDDNDEMRTMNLSEQALDWENMLDDYSTTYTDEQANAVAYLMKACGYISSMTYGLSFSGAYNEDAIYGAQKYFGYNESALQLQSDEFTLADWQDLLYNNIATVGPTYYGGDDCYNGHAFVCDGYSEDGFFHFNWGWGGAYDGYFQLTALIPQGQGAGGNVGGYTLHQKAFFNLVPPEHATIELPELSPLILYSPIQATQQSDNQVTVSGVSTEYYTFYNGTYNDCRVLMGYKAENTETGETTIKSTEQILNFSNQLGAAKINLTISLPAGNYKVSLVSKDKSNNDDSAPWLPLRHMLNFSDYFYLTIDQQGNIAEVTSASIADPVITNFNLQSPITWGNPIEFSYTIQNVDVVERNYGIYPAILTAENALLEMGETLPHYLQPSESVDCAPTCKIMEKFQTEYSGDAVLALISLYSGHILAQKPINVTIDNSALALTAADADAIEMKADRRTGSILLNAPATIAKIEVYGLDGRLIFSEANINANCASVAIAHKGINIVKITTIDGTNTVRKVAL
jgi:hypothetical protein